MVYGIIILAVIFSVRLDHIHAVLASGNQWKKLRIARKDVQAVYVTKTSAIMTATPGKQDATGT